MFDLKLTGTGSTLRKLERAAQKVQHKEIREELKTAMRPALETSRSRVPVDRGQLRRSLRVSAKSNRKGAFAYLITGTRRQLKIPPDDRYYYPAAVEYGTRFQAPRSFLRSALSDKRSEIIGALSRRIRRLLRR